MTLNRRTCKASVSVSTLFMMSSGGKEPITRTRVSIRGSVQTLNKLSCCLHRCLPLYSFLIYLFVFRFLPSTREMWCYNAVIADARVPSVSDIQSRCSILSPELALPSGSNATTTRSHGALHVLGTLLHTKLYYTLTYRVY